jgi:FkbM family methyltransferase
MTQSASTQTHAKQGVLGVLSNGARLRPVISLQRMLAEIRSAWMLADDRNSRLQLALDFALYRVLRVLPRLGNGAPERTVRFRNGIVITYRLNRGDIQGIREIFLDQAYRLPFDCNPSCVVDLGANIGLTSVWLAKTYGATRIVAVEPDPSNAKLVRQNLRANGIDATVIEAAIGSSDGTAFFSNNRESNIGKVASSGNPVTMISMSTLLAQLGEGQMIDVLKLDIEGGEQELLSGNLDWLKRVSAIIAEFHPEVIDYPGCIRAIEGAAFTYLPTNSVFSKSMDAFVNAARA